MADIHIGKAPPLSAVLPFYATGALYFMALCVQFCLSPDSLTGHYFNPHLLAMVHTAALGWGTMIIFGAAYQLLPVICERDLYSSLWAQWSWAFLTVGTLLLVLTFRNFEAGIWMLTGATLIAIAAILYFLNTLLTSGLCKSYSIIRLFMVTAAFWLFITIIIGYLLALHWVRPVFQQSHLEILRLHAHAGLVGWFLQLITGVSSKLIPMFLLGKSPRTIYLSMAFFLQNGGLILFLVIGFFFTLTPLLILFNSLGIIAGVFCWLLYVYDAFRHRAKKKVDMLMKHSLLSLLCLIAACCCIPWMIMQSGFQSVFMYGTLIFMGWITGIILGKTFKTLPFIVWNKHYKSLTGKQKIPMPKQLYKQSWVNLQFYLYVFGLILTITSVAVKTSIGLQISAWIWLLLSLVYVGNVWLVLTHRPKLVANEHI